MAAHTLHLGDRQTRSEIDEPHSGCGAYHRGQGRRPVRVQPAANRDERRGAFDLLLHLQLSIRASATAACIPAPIKLGFDKARARELQWLFTNRRIAPRTREHVQDSFLGVCRCAGHRAPATALGHSPAARRPRLCSAADPVPNAQRTLVISACSSHRARNWLPERYAAVAEHAVRKHGMRVILCGGPAAIERDMAAAIARHVRRAAHRPGRQGHAAAVVGVVGARHAFC